MENADVIVIGAGAAGLMAAHTLCKANRKIIVLEARNRTGGRIHTLDHNSFFKQAELGAEFVHGDLPITLELLQEAGLEVEPAEGEMWRYDNSRFTTESPIDENWDLLMQKLEELEQDVPLSQFLEHYFSEDKYDKLRTSVLQYLSGYDTGDPDRASSFALREEWSHEDEGAQHRVKGGYCALINHLTQTCRGGGIQIYFNNPVKHIAWQSGGVTLTTAEGGQYTAAMVIVALPLGVLQQPKEAEGNISFEPALSDQITALQQMGFGAIIKVLLQFNEIFWENLHNNSTQPDLLNNMAFLFSKEQIPTWWTQAPQHTSLLTGWLGGAPAEKLKHHTEDELLEIALQSLGNIFNYTVDELKDKLITAHVANWSAEPYTCGSYAYDTVESPAARQLLNKGVGQTIFFAGEYLYEGPAMGTVEAALSSGRQTAEAILKNN